MSYGSALTRALGNDLVLAVWVLLLSLSAYGVSNMLAAPPAVKPAAAAENGEFSAERAGVILAEILAEGVPHPSGSEANVRVKERIIAWLDRAGIEHETQRAWGCHHRYYRCALAENVIAYLPGERDSRHLALMAHYDSVPNAPGAGDDGAGVAAILEVARVLKAEGPFLNPLMLIITDAEEAGLLGAEAFFGAHPKADEIGMILNVEGSGTTGASLLLRTAMANGLAVDSYGETAKYPSGASLAAEVFKRMPNDTDFSVSARAGVPGIDFAFAGERNHYHTPNDSLANFDLRTLQHHGENLLPLARQLLAVDLAAEASGNRHFMATYRTFFVWPVGREALLLGVSLLFLLVGASRARPLPVQLLVGATLMPILIVVSAGGIAFLSFMLIGAVNGTVVDWPAHLWPFRLVLFSAMAAGTLLVLLKSQRYVSLEAGTLGAWTIWWLAALAMAILLPAAANVLLISLTVAAPLVAAALWLDHAGWKRFVLTVPIVMVVPHTAGLGLLLEESQGYRLIVAAIVALAFYFVIVAPFLRGSWVSGGLVASTALLIVGLGSAIWLPLYDEMRPQHINIAYRQNADDNTAFWQLASRNPIPQRLAPEAGFANDVTLPWMDRRLTNAIVADPLPLAAPGLSVAREEETEAGRAVDLVIDLPPETHFVQLIPDDTVTVSALRIGTVEHSAGSGLHLIGLMGEELSLSVTLPGNRPFTGYLVAGRYGLPDSGSDLAARRAPLGAPVHQGDQTTVFRQVTF